MSNDLIFVQWTNNIGGLEKISQLYEEKFQSYNPLVVILRYNENGLRYKNSYRFGKKNKAAFIYDYFRFVRKRKKSIFHIQYAGTTILLLTYLAGARKIVFHFHGTMLPGFNKYIWKLVEKKITVIANSLHTQRVIKDKLNAVTNINVIPNLINIDQLVFFKREYNGGKFIITFAGRFDKGKNLDLIINTAKLLKNKNEELEFRLIGDGPEKKNLEKNIRENSLDSFVKLFPFTNDIIGAYKESNLFLFVSLYESFGNVAAEAILTGLPVICYKIPSLTEFIRDDLFFADRPDANLIAEKILEFKNNYSGVTERLVKVNEEVRKYLNSEAICAKLESIYGSFNAKQ